MQTSEIYKIAQMSNIKIDLFSLQKTRSASFCDNGECFIALHPDVLKKTADERVHIAHELGHCLAGGFYSPASPLALRQKHEAAADQWAINHLVPENELLKAMSDGYNEPERLAQLFDVTDEFMKKAINFHLSRSNNINN